MSYSDIEIKSNSKFLKIESGTPHDIRILEDSPKQETIHGFGKDKVSCLGDDCLKCQSGDQAKQRFSTNVYDRGLAKVMIWEFGSGIAKQLKAISTTLDEEEKNITDVDLKVEATGANMSKKYSITPRMTAKPIPVDLKLHDLGIGF